MGLGCPQLSQGVASIWQGLGSTHYPLHRGSSHWPRWRMDCQSHYPCWGSSWHHLAPPSSCPLLKLGCQEPLGGHLAQWEVFEASLVGSFWAQHLVPQERQQLLGELRSSHPIPSSQPNLLASAWRLARDFLLPDAVAQRGSQRLTGRHLLPLGLWDCPTEARRVYRKFLPQTIGSGDV